MLRTVVLLGLLHVSTGTDLTQDAEYMRNGLQAIEAGLAKIPGTARQIAINALLKDVQGSTRLTPDQNDTLANVTVLLNDILELMLATQALRQTELGEIVADIAECNSFKKDLDQELKTNTSTLATDHVECRNAEKTLFDTDAEICEELTEYLSGLTAPGCVKPDATQEMMAQWTTFLAQGLAWFTQQKPVYISKRNPCQESTKNLEDKNAECNLAQHTFETRFCEWRDTRVERCAHLISCTATATERHTNTTTDNMALSDQRILEAGVIMHVLCLVDKLRKGEEFTDFETDCPVPTADTLTQYANTEVAVPPTDSCSTVEVDTNPADGYTGDDGWYPQGLTPAATVIGCF